MVTSVKRRPSGIAQWPHDERPRERLLSRGPHALTDAELIAILLRVGVQGKSAVELARELLKRFGSIRAMMTAPLAAWEGIKGLGQAKVAQMLAALEISRRANLPASRESTVIKSTKQAADYFSIRLRSLPIEHFRVVYLNRRGKVLDDVLIAQGTVDNVHPSARTIAIHALRVNASALIAAHNHSSGIAEPSDSDKILTRDLIAAIHPLGIKVLDHVIIAENEQYSFADMGLLDALQLETLCPVAVKR